MSERILPEPDRFATCPTVGKVLNYYGGTFDAVYVLLHPFIHPISIAKELFKPSSYPDRRSIIANCEPVPWTRVMSLSNLPSIAAIDIALRTNIGGLKKELNNEAYGNRLDTLYDSHDVVPPSEGNFSDLRHNQVLALFQELGHKWAWVGDDLCTERKLYWIEDLKTQHSAATAGHCNVFAADKSLLYTTHWDSHFSFLCGSQAALSRITQNANFEGFFCGPNTDVYWSVHET
jgi:Protein of unknown function (DUF2711)